MVLLGLKVKVFLIFCIFFSCCWALADEEPDYHRILGVPRTASKDEITTAYRRLAMQYHPDRNSDPGAENQFKIISEAYAVLTGRNGNGNTHRTAGSHWRNQYSTEAYRILDILENDLLYYAGLRRTSKKDVGEFFINAISKVKEIFQSVTVDVWARDLLDMIQSETEFKKRIILTNMFIIFPVNKLIPFLEQVAQMTDKKEAGELLRLLSGLSHVPSNNSTRVNYARFSIAGNLSKRHIVPRLEEIVKTAELLGPSIRVDVLFHIMEENRNLLFTEYALKELSSIQPMPSVVVPRLSRLAVSLAEVEAFRTSILEALYRIDSRSFARTLLEIAGDKYQPFNMRLFALRSMLSTDLNISALASSPLAQLLLVPSLSATRAQNRKLRKIANKVIKKIEQQSRQTSSAENKTSNRQRQRSRQPGKRKTSSRTQRQRVSQRTHIGVVSNSSLHDTVRLSALRLVSLRNIVLEEKEWAERAFMNIVLNERESRNLRKSVLNVLGRAPLGEDILNQMHGLAQGNSAFRKLRKKAGKIVKAQKRESCASFMSS